MYNYYMKNKASVEQVINEIIINSFQTLLKSVLNYSIIFPLMGKNLNGGAGNGKSKK